MRKVALAFRSCVIRTVVFASEVLVIPTPTQPVNWYPTLEEAEIGAEEFQSKVPDPVTEPPVPADARSVYRLIEKDAEAFRSCVMSAVVVVAFRSVMPSPIHPVKE